MVKSLGKAAGTIVRLLFVICAFHFSIFFAVSANAGLEPINCGAGPCPEVLASGQLSGAAINSLGEVVWSQQDGQNPDQIFSSTRGQLTNEPTWHFSPAINNLGDMVWVEYSNGNPYGYTLRGIIAGQPVTLAASETNWIDRPDINDRGEVVWIQQDIQNYNQIYSNIRGQLTSGAHYHATPSINNQGDVVFTRSDATGPVPWQIYKISAGSMSPVAVTSDSLNHGNAAINDSGEIVWTESMTESTDSYLIYQVVSSVRGVLVTPTTDIYGVDLNNCGDVVYVTSDSQNILYRLGNSAPCVTHHGTNDTLAQASPVTFGSIFTGLIDSTANQVDWYRFDATAGDNIHITFNFDNRSPNTLNIGLYDGQGNLLSGPTTTSPLGIHTQAGFNGSYYLKMESQGGRFGYSVSLSKYTKNCGAGPCPEVLTSGQLAGAAINSLGEVVWSQQDGQNPNQIFSSTRGQLTNEPTWHFSPAINNLGDMVWVEYSNGNPYGYTLRGIIAGQPVTLAASETNWIGDPDINDRGEVVWAQQDSQNYQLYSNIRGQLTSGAYYCATPHINNQGDVVFTRFDGNFGSISNQVYKISAGSTTAVAVTSDVLDYRSTAINDSGEIVWSERDISNPASFSRVVSSVRGVLVPPTTEIWSVDLNNCGDVVYVTNENGLNKLYRLGNSAPCVTAHLGVFHGNGEWNIDSNGNGAWDGTSTDGLYTYGTGLTGAVPVIGDWTGYGTSKLGVYDNGVWYLDLSGNGVWDGTSTDKLHYFGFTGTIPVTGDWTGTETTKIGVYHDGTWYLDLNGNGAWDGTPTDGLYIYGTGLTGAVPVTGDWTGTGTTKIGVYHDGTWYLDLNGNSAWDGTPTDGLYTYGTGLTGALPVTGDWNGSGTSKIGVFADGTWYLNMDDNGTWDPVTDVMFTFGTPGDKPVTGKW